MRLDDYRSSDNVRDDGEGSGGGVGLGGGGGGMFGLLLSLVGSRFGLVGVLLVVGAAILFGGNPLALMGGGQQALPDRPATRQGAAQACAAGPAQRFSCQVLASTEDTWGKLFAAQGQSYRPTTLVFYRNSDSSGCGAAQSAMGPFYCPTDKSVYLDTSFYDELKTRFGAPGDFAQAYVVAHEVGHHVQDLLGLLPRVTAQQQQLDAKAANALQVRVELQADCYAGVWAANNRDRIEPGDVEEGLRAAHAIGDDVLQQQAQGRVVPDSFTHGSAAQRMAWLKKGLDTGDPARCDTFAAGADA
ncbi:KPN_02809 family neutral zinc metallopeptidase [Sphingomonas morindae]|uniref:Zinc metallopeptidase n=1 Tax=Sphingomonas morindae TaxID=1541170 RepID=A0ABY4XAR9_9SPHN|nr:neutral zinc metallopeptidase [Sphingomonas morindae]USI74018.1 zinc metallopeptidase [Sphingomonas morindae]